MSNITNTQNAIANAGDVSIVSWATKSGKEKAAYSATGAALAPKAVRLSAAMTQDLAMLKNGQFRPFLKDLHEALTPGHIKALETHMRAFYAVGVDSDDVATVRASAKALATGELLQANKSCMTGLAQFLAAPKKIVKGIEVPCEAKGKLKTLADVLLAYVAPATDEALM